MITAYTNRKFWWKCEKGHEWYALASTRSYGSKCPYCSGIYLLKGFNDLATCHPELAAEWSEKNVILKPYMVNDKSTKMVWWKCMKCGFEWLACIKTRAKGSQCPICSEREVHTGYNDLATSDPALATEWDAEKNTLCVNKVSRNSLYSVWWKCSHGHSWKARIADRAIENKGCKICEQEYMSVFPEFLISLYARRNNIKAVLHSDEQTGIEIDAFLQELNLAIDCHGATNAFEKNENSIKEHICKQSGIEYLNIPFKGNTNTYAIIIRNLFRRHHIIISSDERTDNETINEMFKKWRRTY